ncbi:hypothetical protein [Gottfriedia sp. OAE603]|uniref:hypothetical protein n=1 Tax=Gottfriedia sp. OAE603 TaxID=2663872 RepID=UPI0019E9E72A
MADHTKFHQRQHYKALTLESIDTIITNQEIPNDLNNMMIEHGVEVILANQDEK